MWGDADMAFLRPLVDWIIGAVPSKDHDAHILSFVHAVAQVFADGVGNCE
jgi:hypothetical protein